MKITHVIHNISFFSSCDLDLDKMTLNLTQIFWQCTCTPKMKFLGQGFQKLEHGQKDRQTHRDWQFRQSQTRMYTL